jgi:DNA-binding GntR family transcriptional regulator
VSSPRGAGARPATTANTALLSDLAYTAIRDKLVRLQIAPGAPIDEARLAAELNLGRTPVREAIKRLAYQRLVVVYPRSGSYAADIDVTDLTALCDIRELLEGLAAERAAVEARYDERRELERLLAELDSDCAPDKLLELDAAAHRMVHRSAHNDYLLDMLTQTLDLSLRIWNLARERLPHLGEHVHSNAAVLRAILDRDAPKAGELARRHVREFENEVKEMF